MKLTFLGTGSPIPDASRAGPATLVQAGGLNLLFDCGRGVLMRLAAAGIPTPALIHMQLLTHLHSDHVTDFNDVVTTRWVTSPVDAPLHVVGPPGTATFAERTVEALSSDIGWRLAHHDDLNWDPGVLVAELEAGPVEHQVLDSAGVTVTAAPTEHRPVHPTCGYRVEHDGGSVVIAGDTVPCVGLSSLVAGADVYVQTVIREDIIRQIPLQRLQDVTDYHSTVVQAAQTAAEAEVGTLVLVHMVPSPAPGDEAEWIGIARQHFDGTVLAPNDLDSLEI
ncbi:MAG: MBL fold metallo-hydrolase [Microthrixaceae bacterium]